MAAHYMSLNDWTDYILKDTEYDSPKVEEHSATDYIDNGW